MWTAQFLNQNRNNQYTAKEVTLLEQAGELRSRISGFGAHWQEVKPHGMPSGDPALMLLKMEDYSKQLADLQEEAHQMAADCAHFSMEDPDFSQLDTISDDISATRVCINMALLTCALHNTTIFGSSVRLQLCTVTSLARSSQRITWGDMLVVTVAYCTWVY